MPPRYQSRQALARPQPRPVDGRKILARNLKKWRATRKLTQIQLAKLSGLNRAFLSMIENTHRNISVDNICRLAAALDVHPQRLLDDEES